MTRDGARPRNPVDARNIDIGIRSRSALLAPTSMSKTDQMLARAFVWLLALVSGANAAAQHSHVNAGAKSPTVGSQLSFANGAGFEAASGFLIHLNPVQSPAYGPIFYGGNTVTFTALPAFPDNGGPSALAALPGTRIDMVFETLDGPAGGALSLWDSFDGFFDATEITFTVPVGTTAGIHGMALSENDGTPGTDPYGHIHGRKFSANLPGLYVAGFRLVDRSANGPAGTPLHAPSELAYFNFQAGVTIADLAFTSDGVRVRFGSDTSHSYFLETTDDLAPASQWRTIAGPIPGTGRLITVESIPAMTGPAYFRLRAE